MWRKGGRGERVRGHRGGCAGRAGREPSKAAAPPDKSTGSEMQRHLVCRHTAQEGRQDQREELFPDFRVAMRAKGIEERQEACV